ncbi:MAG: GIY-YIG nuclease family protein [Bacillota bacterium]|nr:GIY-YIG nuclease family protein [Bacillota bacterium]
MYGKTIELFLVNGTADSLITAELSNWNGKAIKIPRTEVQDCERDDIRGAGVYFLFCKKEDGDDAVYIGEAESVLDRLKQHLRDYQTDKEEYYWNTAVVFVGRDLNKALIRYLEDRLVKMARECDRYKVLTKNTYSKTVMKESQIATMEEFIENIRTLIATLGYNVLTAMPKAADDTKYLYCKGSGAHATGFISVNGITVLKGSLVSESTTPSFETRGKSYFKLRKKLEKDGTIQNRVFQKDYEFNAPSAASAVVMGRTSNGNVDWKDENGVRLKEL